MHGPHRAIPRLLENGTRDSIEVTVPTGCPRKQQKVTVTLAGLGLKAEAAPTQRMGASSSLSRRSRCGRRSAALHDGVCPSKTTRFADRIGFRTIKTAHDILLNDSRSSARHLHSRGNRYAAAAYSVEDARMLSAGPRTQRQLRPAATTRTTSTWPRGR